ncbi:hypothetical protein LR948_00920 [Roseivivax sp. GX 12232]|uniref:hypothetical protein n=1 Tax=Roseivivax sp. GX 12232 TaxID=2900547 RepID=UPI001E4CDB61|nr:hypothetical protein [Roseivivax sp. GX 12232]MCE0503906.1 hypothetical protein [Roseivivax sp. GX 12232]
MSAGRARTFEVLTRLREAELEEAARELAELRRRESAARSRAESLVARITEEGSSPDNPAATAYRGQWLSAISAELEAAWAEVDTLTRQIEGAAAAVRGRFARAKQIETLGERAAEARSDEANRRARRAAEEDLSRPRAPFL